jgi:hypothetical protein
MKDNVPKFRHKVVAISGDCNMPGMGLKPSDRSLLMEDVTHVFHVAATVRFDEKLRLAVGINVMGTHDVLELAKEMKKLKVHCGAMPFFKSQEAFSSDSLPWVVTPCSLIQIFWRFGVAYGFHLQVRRVAKQATVKQRPLRWK